MTAQPIYDLAPLCYEKGIRDVILCPGSRCAPLTLAFSRFGKFTMRTFSDERSAAFIALGIAQQQKKPVILICTSGSAVYNFAPAVAEAYFAETPLVVLSADRPTEWIGQHDGQTIFQHNVFGNHVKRFIQLPQEYEHADNAWSINRHVNDAINTACEKKQGPVHINIPLREPLYPAAGATISFSSAVRVIDTLAPARAWGEESAKKLAAHWQKNNRILVVCGQDESNPSLTSLLRSVSEKRRLPVVADILSNQHALPGGIRHADAFLAAAPRQLKESLQPEILITFGKSIISKQVKIFLRSFSPRIHWHVQEAGDVADTFKSLTHIARVSPEAFFSTLNTFQAKGKSDQQQQHAYCELWQSEERASADVVASFFPRTTFGEFEAVKEVLAAVPAGSHVHLANSMSVRYANFVSLHAHQRCVVHANRGTSGIDGCTSTVVGHCLANPDVLHLLITGDIAFFYDRNAFWHQYPLPNLRIVLLNNHGGVIFKLIDGPSDLPEADEYFVARQSLSAKHICAEFNIERQAPTDLKSIQAQLKSFYERHRVPKILEIETDGNANKAIFEAFKEKIKTRYES